MIVNGNTVTAYGNFTTTEDMYVVRCSYDGDDNLYIIGEFVWEEMSAAYKNGCPVFLQISNSVENDGTFSSDTSVEMYPIEWLDFGDGMAFFRKENAKESTVITIYNNGKIEKTTDSNLDSTLTLNMPASAKAVGEAIGDIFTALDQLHAYAEALKGGESA